MNDDGEGSEGIHNCRSPSCRALKASQAALAAEQYSQALQLEHPPSIPFAAVLHANRAAARQSLGQHAEAVADCLRATALKPSYAKARCCRLPVLAVPPPALSRWPVPYGSACATCSHRHHTVNVWNVLPQSSCTRP